MNETLSAQPTKDGEENNKSVASETPQKQGDFTAVTIPKRPKGTSDCEQCGNPITDARRKRWCSAECKEQHQAATLAAAAAGLPIIDLLELTAPAVLDLVRELVAADNGDPGEPILMRRTNGGKHDLVRLPTAADFKADAKLSRTTLLRVTETWMRDRLQRLCLFVRGFGGEGDPIIVEPPLQVIRMLIDETPPPVPLIAAVVDYPVLVGDELMHSAGLNEERRVRVVPPASGLPSPLDPTPENVATSVQRLRKLLAEVHFADPDTGPTAAVARMLTPMVRWQSEATMQAPITLVSKSDTQVGATSLLRLCHAAATGRPPVTSAMPETNEEMLKKITARVFADPASAWLLDNAKKGSIVGYDSLSTLMTSQGHWTERRLGVSEEVDVAHCLLVDITGINIGFSDELVSRVVVIPLEAPGANMAHWRWKHSVDDMLKRLAISPKVRQALLTLIQAWLDAGQPQAPKADQLASYQQLVDAISGILWHAGMGQWDTGRGLLERIDEATLQWSAYLEAWADLQDQGRLTGECTTADLLSILTGDSASGRVPRDDLDLPVRLNLPSGVPDLSDKQRMTRALRKVDGKWMTTSRGEVRIKGWATKNGQVWNLHIRAPNASQGVLGGVRGVSSPSHAGKKVFLGKNNMSDTEEQGEKTPPNTANTSMDDPEGRSTQARQMIFGSPRPPPGAHGGEF